MKKIALFCNNFQDIFISSTSFPIVLYFFSLRDPSFILHLDLDMKFAIFFIFRKSSRKSVACVWEFAWICHLSFWGLMIRQWSEIIWEWFQPTFHFRASSLGEIAREWRWKWVANVEMRARRDRVAIIGLRHFCVSESEKEIKTPSQNWHLPYCESCRCPKRDSSSAYSRILTLPNGSIFLHHFFEPEKSFVQKWRQLQTLFIKVEQVVGE